MNQREIEQLVPKAARNELFYFVARASGIFMTVVALPIAGVMLTRVIAQQDAVQVLLTQQNVDLHVLSATVKDKLDMILTHQNDQELRLRQLEQRK